MEDNNNIVVDIDIKEESMIQPGAKSAGGISSSMAERFKNIGGKARENWKTIIIGVVIVALIVLIATTNRNKPQLDTKERKEALSGIEHIAERETPNESSNNSNTNTSSGNNSSNTSSNSSNSGNASSNSNNDWDLDDAVNKLNSYQSRLIKEGKQKKVRFET